MPARGIGKLVDAKLLAKVIVSHIGLNPETQRQMMSGELEVELVPQGTLIERIRAGGHGLGVSSEAVPGYAVPKARPDELDPGRNHRDHPVRAAHQGIADHAGPRMLMQIISEEVFLTGEAIATIWSEGLAARSATAAMTPRPWSGASRRRCRPGMRSIFA
jgi:hypothetical protein